MNLPLYNASKDAERLFVKETEYLLKKLKFNSTSDVRRLLKFEMMQLELKRKLFGFNLADR